MNANMLNLDARKSTKINPLIGRSECSIFKQVKSSQIPLNYPINKRPSLYGSMDSPGFVFTKGLKNTRNIVSSLAFTKINHTKTDSPISEKLLRNKSGYHKRTTGIGAEIKNVIEEGTKNENSLDLCN